MIFDFINRLRARPLAYRRRFVVWTTSGITAIIVVIWVISVSIRFKGVASAPADPRPSGPLQTFLGQIRSGVASFKQSVDTSAL